MTRICATCKLVLGVIDDGIDAFTHTLCADCAEKLYMQMFPVGARVTRGERHGEVVKHLQTRVMVLWDGAYDEEADTVAASTLYREVVSSTADRSRQSYRKLARG